MTREEQLACLEDRPCSVCKFHTDRCNRWTCVFEDEPEEQEPCEDCITLRLEKGTLKYSDKDYVVYKKEWLKKWWQPELALLGIELPSIQPKIGHWRAVYQGDEIINYRCTECELGNTFGRNTYRMNYCPNCGAKMLPTDSEKER